MTLETLNSKLLTLGIPGLFLISFLDSAGVPLPGGADLVRMDWRRFVAAVFAGRLIRFLAEAYLAVTLGDRAAETLKEDYPSIAGALAAAVDLSFCCGDSFSAARETRRLESAHHRDADIASKATGSAGIGLVTQGVTIPADILEQGVCPIVCPNAVRSRSSANQRQPRSQ